MAIRVEGPDGRVGTLDVVKLAQEEMGAEVVGVQQGLVVAKKPDGKVVRFSLAAWAQQNQARVVQVDGFNAPETALDIPPMGMNYMDQSAFYHDGMDMAALQELFPQAQKRGDGRVVVLDSDGLWKTMWSPYLVAPMPAPSFQEQVAMNEVNDPRLVMREAGITFLMSLAGIERDKDLKPGKIVKMLRMLSRNCPYENKFQIGKMAQQTVGLDPFKFYNALLAPEEVGEWLRYSLDLTSFQFRMKQAEMAELVVDGMRANAQKEFALAMSDLMRLPETKKLRINLKALFSEFVSLLSGLDLLRDISKTTGLNEWIALNEDMAFDKSKLPPMPKFVAAFVQLLKWAMPIVQQPALAFASGKKGFKSIMALMVMIDECIYSLAGVPDSSAKYKMFMALKKLQTQLENKLCLVFQPMPEDNKDGLKENPFMQAKQYYSPKREELYKICQLPRESWNNTILQSLRSVPNLEQFYDRLHPLFAGIMKSFAAMDTAYDLQPWVDANHAERTHDPFSQQQESFGLPPPEAGYLAKNSPRAVQNIAETLVEGSGIILSMSDEERKEMLRNPYLLAQMFKTLMVASVNRELGTVEILAKFGMTQDKDRLSSPDPTRIWEDPDVVQKDIDAQVQELMGAMAMEQMMQKGQQEQQDAEAQGLAEAGREEKAGPGPAGPSQKAVAVRR